MCFNSPPAPSAAPADLIFLSSTSSSISIQWEAVPCIHRNGNITGYVIQYKEVDEGMFINEMVTENQREANISGFTSSTLYDIRIAAVNSAGTGPFTSFIATTSGVYIKNLGEGSHYFKVHLRLCFSMQPCPWSLS